MKVEERLLKKNKDKWKGELVEVGNDQVFYMLIPIQDNACNNKKIDESLFTVVSCMVGLRLIMSLLYL